MKTWSAGIAACVAGLLGLPILLLISLGGAAPAAAAGTMAVALCRSTQTTSGIGLNPDAAAAAQAIVAAGQRAGVGEAGWTIALDVALARTDLRPGLNGPAGAVGIFAIRPAASTSADQLRDPAQAAQLFYRWLTAIPGWASLPMSQAAQQTLPELTPGSYAQTLPKAQQIAAALNPSNASPLPMPTAPPTDCGPTGTSVDGVGIDAVLAFARAQVGKAYVLGANGPDAWDCSSLVQAAFRAAGIQLPRVADVQYEWVREHGSVFPGPVSADELQPGDLLFSVGDDPDTTDDGQRIGHVALYAGDGEVVEAKGARWGVIETAYTPGHWAYITWVGRLAPPSTPTPTPPSSSSLLTATSSSPVR